MTGSILRLKDLIQRTGLSRSAIYDRLNPKSPRYAPDFPKPFNLGGTAIGWYESAVESWLALCSDQSKTDNAKRTTSALTSTSLKPNKSQRDSPTVHQTRHSQPAGTLAEMITAGGQINAVIESYLSMPTWTPAMGALLVNGVIPPERCLEIPPTGVGLDGIDLPASHPRLVAAKKTLNLYVIDEEETVSASEITPLDFYIWCDESAIDTVWLRHFNAVGQITKSDDDLGAAAFALLTRR